MNVRSAITNKVITMSSSSRDKVKRCPRRWWFEKVAGRPREESPAMAFGSAVHDIAERWLRVGDAATDGDTSRAARVFNAGKHLLPKPGTVHAEHWLAGTCGPLKFSGKVDARPNGPTAYHPDVPSGAWILDHKTTGNMRYAKGPSTLACDLQMHAYAFRVWGPAGLDAGFADDERIGFVHVYYATKGRPTGLRVFASTTWARVVDSWLDVYLPTALQMRQLAAVTVADDVPANPGACNDFFKLCEHAAECSSSPQNCDRWSLIFND